MTGCVRSETVREAMNLLFRNSRNSRNPRGEKDYFVRGTFTRNNLDFGNDVLHYADLGFEKLSMEPVVAARKSRTPSVREDLTQIMDEYDRLAKEFVKRQKEGRGFKFFHFMLDLSQGPCVAKRLSGCGSGTEYLAVTPWGDLYPCHQFVGNEEFLLGNVDTGVVNTKVRDEFKLCNVYAKEKCKTALRDSTAAADARQIPSTSTAALRMPTISVAKCRKNVSSARL